MFISNNRLSFHLWWNENMVKHRKVPKYYENDCRPTLDLTPVIFNYAFMIRLDKCNGGCNVVNHVSAKVCVPSETKSVNVKIFNMITRNNEAKKLVKDLWWHCKCKSDSTACNSNQNEIIKYASANVKAIKRVKMITVGILVHVFVRMVSIQKVLMIQWLRVMK